MKVKAISGVRVPMENAPHKYITDSVAVEVENTLYYRRRIADGDLIRVVEPTGTARTKKTDEAEAK
ncbi:DUF2635 domain-containing protein [Conservatibacter flavescens]|uniref:DUF2635 domain-containing protein n=1 Tax=Conservatibacter flavescens TaxID=28161 RepID=A0A2M8S4Z9_9PAST|nr:DUF2635 domain-containing protein [Conservatibacter flavescens]PJG86215.1 DUF2635 domain-containing protein [Conservatibacter flavescens]